MKKISQRQSRLNAQIMHEQHLRDLFSNIMQVGANRHPTEWLACNELAVNAICKIGSKPDDLETKTLASLIVLRLLERLRRPGMSDVPDEDSVKDLLQNINVVKIQKPT